MNDGVDDDDDEDNDTPGNRETTGRPKKRVRWAPEVITPERRRKKEEFAAMLENLEQEWRANMEKDQKSRALAGEIGYFRYPRLYVTSETERVRRAEAAELMAQWIHGRVCYGHDTAQGQQWAFYYWALVEEKCAKLDHVTAAEQDELWAQAYALSASLHHK